MASLRTSRQSDFVGDPFKGLVVYILFPFTMGYRLIFYCNRRGSIRYSGAYNRMLGGGISSYSLRFLI
jgi:hypothetical protein